MNGHGIKFYSTLAKAWLEGHIRSTPTLTWIDNGDPTIPDLKLNGFTFAVVLSQQEALALTAQSIHNTLLGGVTMIEKVKGSLQGAAFDVSLGNLTLLVGPNASGKDRIIRGIDLLSRGRAADVAGKDEAASSELLDPLFGEKSDEISAEGIFVVDGVRERGSYTLIKGKKAKQHGPTVSFPLRDLMTAVQEGSPARQQRALLALLNVRVGDVDVEPALRKWEDMKAQINLLEKGIAAARNDGAVLEQTLPIEVDRGALTSEVQGLREEVTRYDRYIHLSGEYQRWTADVAKLKAKIQPAATLPEIDLPRLERLRAVLEDAVVRKEAGCMACGRECDPSHMVARLSSLEGYLTQFRLERVQYQEAQQAQQELLRAEEALAAIWKEGASLGTPRNVREEYERQLRRLQEVDTFSSTRNRVVTLQAEVQRMSRERDGLVLEFDVLGKMMRESLETAMGALLSDARRFAGDVFPGELTLDLGTYKEPKFLLGFRREGFLVRALSGAEGTVAYTALALALAERSSKPSVLIPPERAWSTDRLTRWMEVLAAAKPKGQVILTSVVPMNVGGWVGVTFGKDQGSSTATLTPETGVPPAPQSEPEKKRRGRKPKVKEEPTVELGSNLGQSKPQPQPQPMSELPTPGTGIWRGTPEDFRVIALKDGDSVEDTIPDTTGRWFILKSKRIAYQSESGVEVWGAKS